MTPGKPASLGIITVGMGAVASTLFAGVEAIRKNGAPAIGSLTQLGRLPLDAAPGETTVKISELLDLTPLDEIVFGAWDLLEKDAYEAAKHAGVLNQADLARHRKFLKTIQSMPGVVAPRFTVGIDPTRVKSAKGLQAQVEALRADLRDFKRLHRCKRLIVLCCMSVEAYVSPGPVHASLKAFEAGLKADDPSIAPSQLYAYAVLSEGIPFVNGTPNVIVEVPALRELAKKKKAPLAGSDFKSGQTYMKTVLAAGFRNRLLGLTGWFSTNILGNRDGIVLENPQAFEAKKISKSGVISDLCPADHYPELYGNIEHLVKINYFGPRGDNKEAWDAIDLQGWLGYPMAIKVNFECRDSILASPLALDLLLLSDLAARQGYSGVLDWLAFYFKTPAVAKDKSPGNDPNKQLVLLEKEICRLAGAGKRRS